MVGIAGLFSLLGPGFFTTSGDFLIDGNNAVLKSLDQVIVQPALKLVFFAEAGSLVMPF